MTLAQRVLDVVRGVCVSPIVSLSRRKTRRSRPHHHRCRLRGFEPLEQRDLLSATVGLQGWNIAATNDPDDQISEARSLGTTEQTRSFGGSIAAEAPYGPDVDMFSFAVSAGQKIAFDIDRPTSGGIGDSYIRLFNGSGAQLLANDNGPAPRESFATDAFLSYMEYTFNTAGTYYLGVSGYGNTAYNPISGSGDVKGSTGQYTLTVTPITRTLTAVTGVNEIDGKVTMPNPGLHRSDISVFLKRVDPNGASSPTLTIENGRQTWLVIHGRDDSSASFIGLASAIDGYQSGDQVLVLNWSEGANDNHWQQLGLDGSEWIPYVADWTSGVLGRIGLNGTSEFLVGHSWGTFLSYEIGSRVTGGVKGLVALDPALAGVGFPDSAVNFRSVSAWSWAFYGDDVYGSARKSGTANESFVLQYDGGGLPLRGLPLTSDALAAHRAPVHLFESLVRRNNTTSDPRAILFSLGRLQSASAGPWKSDVYCSSGNPFEIPRQVFEGVFKLKDLDGDGEWGDTWNELLSFRYTDHTTNGEVTV